MTDITGFGLIGHAREIALASDVSLELDASRIPFLPGALEYVSAGYIPGGLKNNRDFAECVVEYDEAIPNDVRALLFDPQTAGGLLIAVAPQKASDLLESLLQAGVQANEIGRVKQKTKPLIRARR